MWYVEGNQAGRPPMLRLRGRTSWIGPAHTARGRRPRRAQRLAPPTAATAAARAAVRGSSSTAPPRANIVPNRSRVAAAARRSAVPSGRSGSTPARARIARQPRPELHRTERGQVRADRDREPRQHRGQFGPRVHAPPEPAQDQHRTRSGADGDHEAEQRSYVVPRRTPPSSRRRRSPRRPAGRPTRAARTKLRGR